MSTATMSSAGITEKAAILAVIENMRKANHDKNVELFAEQFTLNASVSNLAPPLTHYGIDKHEKQEWFDGWSTPIDIESRDFTVEVSGDIAFCYGFLHMKGSKVGMEAAISFWMRETLCLKRGRSGWKVVHEHTSVPFYMDASLRPAFDLKP